MSSLKSNIWKLYLSKFFLSLHFFSAVLIPFFTDWAGISFTQIMILQSVFVVSVFLLEIPTGAIADYFGRKTSIILGSLVIVVGALIYISIPNFYVFVVAEFLWGLGIALSSGSNEALIYDTLKSMKKESISKKVFSNMQTFGLIGIMIAAGIGSIIASKMGLSYTMLFTSLSAFAATITNLFLVEPRIKTTLRYNSYFQIIKSGTHYFQKHKILKILSFDMISITTLSFLIIWIYQLLLQENSVPIIYFGMVHILLTISQVLIINTFNFWEKLAGSRKNYLFWSALIPGISFLILAFTNNIIIILLSISLITGFGLTRQVLYQSYLNKHIESHNRATVMSTISMVERFVKAIVFPIVGLLVDKSLTTSLIIVGILTLAATLFSRVEESHLLD